MIPYAPGRDRLTKQIVATLNAGEEFIAVTPAQRAAIGELESTYPTLLQTQKQLPNEPAGFTPWKLGTPAPSTPLLNAAICWMGTIAQTGTAIPVLTETTAAGLTLTTHRTSAGFYTVSGFPTGYSIHAAVNPVDQNRAVTISVSGQTVTIKSYSAGSINDDLLAANPTLFILMPT